jgi:hypothetical protein
MSNHDMPPRRGGTRPGELPPPPRITVNRIEHDDDDGGYAPRRSPRPPQFNGSVLVLVLIAGVAAAFALLAGSFRPYLCQISRATIGVQMADCPIDPSLPDAVVAPPTPNSMIVVITPTAIIRDKGAILLKTKKLSELLTYRKSYSDQITLSQAASNASMQQLLNWAEQFTRTINYDVQQHGRDTVVVDFHGSITYGVVLSELTEDYITVSPDQQDLTIVLPPSKILNVDVDLEQSQILARDQGFLAQPLLNIDIDVLHVGELQILKQCTGDDMLAAAQQAQVVLSQILALSDFRNVTITPTPGACSTTLPQP